jgi:hypothetical protein
MNKPSSKVYLTLQAVYCLFTDSKEMDWGSIRQHLLGNSHLVDEIKAYDKDKISVRKVRRAQAIITKNSLTPELVMNASQPASHLLCWVLAIINYHKIIQNSRAV